MALPRTSRAADGAGPAANGAPDRTVGEEDLLGERGKGGIRYAIFAVSFATLTFIGGMAIATLDIFPYRLVSDAAVTLRAYRHSYLRPPRVGELSPLPRPLRPLDTPRIRSLADAGGHEGILLFGGLNEYLDLCPGYGCLAVEYDRKGAVRRAIPYRPKEIYAANRTPQFRYESVAFDPIQSVTPIGIEQLGDDLVVTFQVAEGAALVPWGAGTARVGPDGRPRWFRFDYTHHWPRLLPDGRLALTGSTVATQPLSVRAGIASRATTLACVTRRPFHDFLRIVDIDGTPIRDLLVLEQLVASDQRGVLERTIDACDPTHLNFIDVLRPSAAGAIAGTAPGDFVVSLRNVSAFAVIDPADGRIKRLFHGSFVQQHSVHHLDGSRFLMFDNRGDPRRAGGARLLEVDVATGHERTVFPTETSGAIYDQELSGGAGFIDISPDRKRALVSFTETGNAYEVRLWDGAVLTEITNVHAVAGVKHAFLLYGAAYAHPRR